LTPAASPVTTFRMTEDLTALSFEDALKRLETIVQRLESGDASLDESITLYTEGDALRTQCERRLKDAQARIEKISLGSDGIPIGTAPFDGS
jgi:exodeoxyribonuclease VII small subunit